jgi:RNA polymerase sigma-70 factor (ECF subfamily)
MAYRMLGSSAEAEEVVQDAWLRWNAAAQDTIQNPEAWLVTITTRLAIDRLRVAKLQREHYVGTWLPEPQFTDLSPSPEQSAELAEDVSVAFLAMLERLAPEARAALLLREVFDASYREMAQTLGKSEAACRQLVHRAKSQVREERPRFIVPRETHLRLLRTFVDASASGSFEALTSVLAEGAELIGDGGGKVPSFGKPLLGGRRIAQLYYAAYRRYGAGQRIELAVINGQWGVLRFFDDVLESAQSFDIEDERIVRIYVQRNPEKLAKLVVALRH